MQSMRLVNCVSLSFLAHYFFSSSFSTPHLLNSALSLIAKLILQLYELFLIPKINSKVLKLAIKVIKCIILTINYIYTSW